MAITKNLLCGFAGLVLLGFGAAAFAAEELRPFVLAESQGGSVDAAQEKVVGALEGAGFEVVGRYSPYPGATVYGVTSDALKQAASATDFGAFGAVQRVAVTDGDAGVHVSYTNPTYMAHAYRMQGDLGAASNALSGALGAQREYGAKEGLTPEQLREYHYKFLMPYFDDRIELVAYGSQDEAVNAVEKALAEKKGGAEKVYRVDLADGTAVFGVAMSEECSGDGYIMERIDFAQPRSTAHLPYEMVVRQGKVYTLPAEFRIAINFPDLSMVGSNSFASIMCAPNAIESALSQAAGGQPVSAW